MATRTIKTRLELENDQKYKESLKQISSGMGVLKSEMSKVSAEFDNNADSVEALTKKNDVLERQILTQKEKIDVLKKALQDSAAAYGESDARTQNWQKQLNLAEADLAKMENQVDANTEAMKKSDSAVDKLADKFGNLLPDNIKNALGALGNVSTTAIATAGAVAGVIKLIADAEKKLMDMTRQSAAFADNILTESIVSGVSTDTLQAWDYASQLIDVDVSTMTGSISKLVKSMNSARDGSEATAEKFRELGVSIVDNVTGELRSGEDVFYEVIDALGNIQNETERDAAAMELFGKSAQELNPLIVQGSQALKDYTKEAEDNAYILTRDQLAALGAVDDAQQRLLKTQEAVSNQISAQYAPYMESALTMTRDAIKEIGDQLVKTGVVNSLGSILQSVTSMIQPITNLAKDVLPVLAAVLDPIAGLCAWIADTANAVMSLLTLNWNGFTTALGFNPNQASNMQTWMYGKDYKNWDTSKSYGGQVYNQVTGMWEGNGGYASGIDYARAGLHWVGENGPELVSMPAGSQVYSAQESRSMGGDVFNITISANNVKEFNDIVSMAQNQRRIARMGGEL